MFKRPSQIVLNKIKTLDEFQIELTDDPKLLFDIDLAKSMLKKEIYSYKWWTVTEADKFYHEVKGKYDKILKQEKNRIRDLKIQKEREKREQKRQEKERKIELEKREREQKRQEKERKIELEKQRREIEERRKERLDSCCGMVILAFGIAVFGIVAIVSILSYSKSF